MNSESGVRADFPQERSRCRSDAVDENALAGPFRLRNLVVKPKRKSRTRVEQEANKHIDGINGPWKRWSYQYHQCERSQHGGHKVHDTDASEILERRVAPRVSVE